MGAAVGYGSSTALAQIDTSTESKRPRSVQTNDSHSHVGAIDVSQSELESGKNEFAVGESVAVSAWRSHWPEFGVADWIVLLGSVAALVTAQIVGPGTSDLLMNTPRFDSDLRNVFRVHGERERNVIRDISDITLVMAAGFAAIVDGVTISLIANRDPKLSSQLVLISAQALAVTGAIQSWSNMVGRQRPFSDRCGSELSEHDIDCEEDVRSRSFFSGHTALSFAGAASSCVFHAKIPELNEGMHPVIPCLISYGLAAGTGLLRMFGDMHYATDVLTGAAVGTLVGTLLPLFKVGSTKSDGPSATIVPFHIGLGVVGTM